MPKAPLDRLPVLNRKEESLDPGDWDAFCVVGTAGTVNTGDLLVEEVSRLGKAPARE